jgi:eukaryotic-like serine/threonine-protein kinase
MHGVLAGRYRLERQLGKGGMGSVWLAEHLALRSWVAVKLMDPAIAATPEGAERFRREAQAAASLRSAHVVQVLDYGVHETTPYLVMELLQGESLASCLERERRLTPERTVSIVTQLARALGRAHAAGIVHRDLKPDNVFLVREDDQELVKVLDFGIAKTPTSQFGGMETRTGVTMGTPYYMSPEQVEGKKAVDYRTDLWAIAVIACECMTGVRPFDGSTFGELLLNICARPIAPPSAQGLSLRGFDEWFAKATNRDPEQRFASAQELANTLKDVVAGASGGHAFMAPGTALMQPAAAAAIGNGAAMSASGPMTAGAPVLAQGAAPSLSSVNMARALEAVRPKPSPLPWILLGLVVLASSLAATLLLLRPKTQSTAEATSDASQSAATAPSVAEDARVAAPQASLAETSGSPAAPDRPRLATQQGPRAAAPSPATPPPVAAPSAKPLVPSTPAPTVVTKAGSSQCFSDPFSGQIRPSGANRPASAPTFACRQDPFTGKYKKL